MTGRVRMMRVSRTRALLLLLLEEEEEEEEAL
jgi:hypothetical protein